MASKTEQTTAAPETLSHFRKVISNEAGIALIKALNTGLISDLASVNAGRRATVRSATLLSANRVATQPSAELISRSVGAWSNSLGLIRDFAALLTAESIEELDDLVAQIDDPTKPYGDMLRTVAVVGMGFSDAEYNWIIDQLQRAGYCILRALSDGDPSVLRALTEAACSGDNGILQLGFLTIANSEKTNVLVSECVARARRANLTVSLFHLLPAMILAAAILGDESAPLAKLIAHLQTSRKQFASTFY